MSLEDAEDYFSRICDFQFRIDMKCFDEGVTRIAESIVNEKAFERICEEIGLHLVV